jgi:hypothetical protein
VKTLAVRQPWATHIAEGSKTIEVRSWRTDYRGPLLIVASGKPLKMENDAGEVETLPTQCQVCVVDLIDVRPWLRTDAPAACMSDDDWDTGFWGWHLANPRHVRPVPHKGRLNLYRTPEGCEQLSDGIHYLDAFNTAG